MVDDKKGRHKNGGIQLIASNGDPEDHNFEYNGFCKIKINHVSSMLEVEPITEEFKYHNFFCNVSMEILCTKETRCQKVYDLIYRKRAKDEATNELIYNRILFPILNQITKVSNIVISQILLKWINKLETNDKEMYIKMLKESGIYDLIYPKNGFAAEMSRIGKDESGGRAQLKRKFCQLNKSADLKDKNKRQKRKTLSSNHFFKSDCEFKIVNVNGKKNMMKRLLVFTSTDKRFCYEYCRRHYKFYICVECKKMGINTYAKMDQHESVRLHDHEHVCTKLQYSLEKYFELQIIEKPNYEILENCNTKSGKILIVFNSNDRTQCHEFPWQNFHKAFRCKECHARVKISNASTENEYIEILILNHECPFRQFDREKYFKFNKFVLEPNFEIRNDMWGGKERKTLIILDKNDKTKCYIYGFDSFHKLFQCNNCILKQIKVSAKLHENSDGENYVILSKKQHVCESVKYIPLKNDDDIILRPPNIKIMTETSNGVGKVFIFDSKNKDLCYIFSQTTSNRYRCLACKSIFDRKCKNNVDKTNGVVYLSLIKDKNGEYFIQIKKGQKHLCQPKKYEPEKYEIKEPAIADKYFYYRKKKYPKSINVAIFHSSNSNLCFTFSYCKSSNYFQCVNCIKLKKCCFISPPKKDENGKEYFIHDPKKHICKPIKVSSIQTPQIQKLQRKDIAFNEKQKINENRILRLPHFELRTSRRGVPEEKLVVFDVKDKSMCFEYFCDTNHKLFICLKCREKKHRVTAKVHEESNEKFIEVSENQHICEPIKDEFEKKIINSSMFVVLYKAEEKMLPRIILFTSETKEFYYEFHYVSEKKIFQCLLCSKLKKYVCVKLCKKENGEEYLMKKKNEHVCTPKKYDQRNFEKPKTVPESMSTKKILSKKL